MLKDEYKKLNVEVSEKTKDKLKDTSKRFGVTMSRLVRLCIDAELPRLIDRETKRRKRQTQ